MKSSKFFEHIYIYPDPVDMRKQINGLAYLVTSSELTFCSRSLFLFTGRNKKTIKAIYWAGSGFCMWMMRLEKQRFPWPKKNKKHFEITSEQFEWLIKGLDFTKIKYHKEITFSRFY